MPPATVYTCRVTNWPMLWLSIVAVVVLTFNIVLTYQGRVLDFLGAALLFIVFVKAVVESSQRISAGPDSLTVHLGLFGFPRVAVARANIAHAEIIDLPVTLWSGWGVAWRPKRGWLLTLDAGPALRLRSASGRRFTVSVKDPAAAMWALGIAP